MTTKESIIAETCLEAITNDWNLDSFKLSEFTNAIEWLVNYFFDGGYTVEIKKGEKK